MYWGLTFTDEAKGKLRAIYAQFFNECVLSQDDWVMYADHITLIHSSHPEWNTACKLLRNFQGHRIEVKLISIGISDDVIAFGVDTKTTNEHSHITMACKKGHKPVESNDIVHWEKLYCTTTLTGMLELRD